SIVAAICTCSKSAAKPLVLVETWAGRGGRLGRVGATGPPSLLATNRNHQLLHNRPRRNYRHHNCLPSKSQQIETRAFLLGCFDRLHEGVDYPANVSASPGVTSLQASAEATAFIAWETSWADGPQVSPVRALSIVDR